MEEIIQTLMGLPANERRRVRDELSLSLLREQDSRQEAEARAQVLLPLAEKAVGVAAFVVDRSPASCLVKRFVAWQLIQEGFGFDDVASAIGKHRTTLYHTLGGMQNMFDYPMAFRGDLKKWDIFQKLIENDETEQRTVQGTAAL